MPSSVFESIDVVSRPQGADWVSWAPGSHQSGGQASSRETLFGYISLVVCVVVYSTLGPDLDLIVDTQPVTKGFWRASCATAAFVCAYCVQLVAGRCFRPLITRSPTSLASMVKLTPDRPSELWEGFLWGVGAGVAFAAWAGIYVLSLHYTTVGDATLFGNVQGVVLVGSRLVLCRPVSLLEVVGCMVAVAGGVLVSNDHQAHGSTAGSSPSLFGNMLGLASSFGGAVYTVLAQRALPRLGTMRMMVVVQATTSCVLLGVAMAAGEMDVTSVTQPLDWSNGVLGWLNPDPDRLWSVLYAGFVMGLFGMGTYAYSLHALSGAVVGGSQLLTPIGAAILSIALHQSTWPGAFTYVGTPLLIVGLLIVIKGELMRAALARHLRHDGHALDWPDGASAPTIRRPPTLLHKVLGSAMKDWCHNGVLGRVGGVQRGRSRIQLAHSGLGAEWRSTPDDSVADYRSLLAEAALADTASACRHDSATSEPRPGAAASPI